jgi:hypothetical protein
MLKRCALVCSLCVSVFLTSSFSGRATATGVATDPTTLPLLQFGDLAYVGGFRLPASSANGDSFSYGGTPLTYNPIDNSLVVGTLSGKVAAVSIPTPINSSVVTDLPFASYVQPFADPTEGHRGDVGSGAELGGLLVFGGRMYGTDYIYYDASNSQTVSHYSRSMTLSEPSFQGMHSVWQNQRAGFVSGYMATVPPEWQALLGGPAITGQCCIPIVTRTSFGPAAFAWNPANLGTTSPLPAVPLLYYTEDHATLGPWTGSDATYGATTKMGGVALIAGTRTALYVGRNGNGPYCYGVGTTDLALAGTTGANGTHYCYDPSNSNQAPHAYPYNYQIWAYDLNDFAAVKAGTKQPWEVVPYGVWPINLPVSEASVMIGGVGYDAARQVLYFSQLQADRDGYAYRSLIQTLKINVPVAAAPAEMSMPTAGSTLVGSTAQLQWTAGTGVSQYWLNVGTVSGGTDLLDQDQGTSLTSTVTGLPTDGRTVYVRLRSRISGAWRDNSYTYTAANTTAPAQLTTPTPGSTLTPSTVQFQWTPGNGVSSYRLSIGTAPGGTDLYDQNRGTNLTATVTGLPATGNTVYVRLGSQISGTWKNNDYTYTVAPTTAPAQLTTPTPGSTLIGSTVKFDWTAGSGVTQYWLEVGTTVGGFDLYGADRGISLTTTVSNLPTDGRSLYVRLWSLINRSWQYNDYTFSTGTLGSPTAKAQMTTPPPGATFTSSTVTFQWTAGIGVSQYWLEVGTGPVDIYGADRGPSLTATVTNMPTNGHPVYVRLWSLLNGTWVYNDYTYTAATTPSTTTPATMATPAPLSTLTSSTATFQWTAGTGASQYWLEVGNAVGGFDIYGADRGTNLGATVSNLPTNGRTLFVRLWSLISGKWLWNDYTYTAATVSTTTAKAQMITPVAASVLTSSTAAFQWTAGTSVSQYWLEVGTKIGTYDIYGADRGTSLDLTVANLPIDGRTVYVRLWSLINGVWVWNDYTYSSPTANGTEKARMTTPAPSSTLTASTMTFQWTNGVGVSQYWLEVGSTVGAFDIYGADRAMSLTATVSSLPANGKPFYVRLWSLINSTWQYIDYSYTAK